LAAAIAHQRTGTEEEVPMAHGQVAGCLGRPGAGLGLVVIPPKNTARVRMSMNTSR
jgi:hypothetical protein